MKSENPIILLLSAHGICVAVYFPLVVLTLCFSLRASAITVRSASDLRLWETVTDRTRPLSWPWEAESDSATLTFSNRLTRTVSIVTVPRGAGEWRGSCAHPVSAETDEALVVATLVQTADGVEVARDAAELAYVPGSAGGTLTVRTKADPNWYRVRSPRLAAFDASWWNVEGPTGYDLLWIVPSGPRLVQREFEGVGVVDEVLLRFGISGCLLLLK